MKKKKKKKVDVCAHECNYKTVLNLSFVFAACIVCVSGASVAPDMRWSEETMTITSVEITFILHLITLDNLLGDKSTWGPCLP